MAFGRSARKRDANVGAPTPYGSTAKANQVMPHGEFIDRIRKSLYFGDDALMEEMEVSRPLAEYASELFSAPHKGHSLNRLSTVTAGSIHASPCSLIMALIYLDRLNVADPSYVRRITPQELFIVSMMISTKFYAGHDEEIYFSDWAEDGHMSEKRLKKLELEFLCAIEWNIYISNEVFFEKLGSVEKQLARREGLRRGWLTYSELIQMLPSFTLAKFILNNIAVMAVSYAASVITIAGAFFLASQIPGTALHRKAMSAVIGGDVAVQQSTHMVEYEATQLIVQQRLRRSNNTEAASSTATTPTVTNGDINTLNDTCNALNVEAELSKLECQYREEEQREAVRQRQHEIQSATRLTLPDAVQRITNGNKKSKNGCHTTCFGIDFVRNWFALKEEYADDRLGSLLRSLEELKMSHQGDYISAAQEKQQQGSDFVEWNVWSLDNCTTSRFWQMFGDTAQQSFVRSPSTWLKFI